MQYRQNAGTSKLFILFNKRNSVFLIEITVLDTQSYACPIHNPKLSMI